MSCDYFMVMEELGQLSIFEVLKDMQQSFTVGDSVRVTITPDSDWEAYNYLEGYCPVALEKPGRIVEVLENNQYLVSFSGAIATFKDCEIKLLKK